MGVSTLTHACEESENAVREGAWSNDDSPGIRLLDALRSRDDAGVLALCGPTTTIEAPGMGWSSQGPEEIERVLAEARAFFPGLSVEPRTRNIGFGLVIDEVRVQDAVEVSEAEPLDEPDEVSAEHTSTTPDHPMWDEPISTQRALAVWREDLLTPMRLNLPVRITVRHDDLQVHEVILEFPAALLKRALGMYVDPLEMSLSEVQSAIIAPVEAGFVTRTLTTPTLGLAPAPPDRTELPDGSEGSEPARPRRRRRVIAPLLVAVLAVGGAGAWWQLRPGTDQQAGSHTAASVASVSDTAPPAPDPRSTATTAGQDAASQTPVVTHAKPSQTPDRKPNVTLKSDLAFGFDSATLSPQARSAVEHVARQVRDNGLTGKIYVDGYTDDLGSQAHGLVLSQRRADAVAHYLGSQLVGVPVTIVSTGHGESRPIADNATSQGRQANRRVTITLPVS